MPDAGFQFDQLSAQADRWALAGVVGVSLIVPVALIVLVVLLVRR